MALDEQSRFWMAEKLGEYGLVAIISITRRLIEKFARSGLLGMQKEHKYRPTLSLRRIINGN